jgi:DNA-binding FadR family transcriptional regulator
LLSLEKSGFIVIKKGATGGGIIAEVGTKSAVDSIKDLINLMQVTLQDIAQVRLILEPPICALAAVKATQNDIGRLREWNEKLRDGFCSGDPIFEHNPRIHTLIAEISGNPLFGILIKALMEVHAYRMLSISLSDEVKKNIIYHHERIIDALEQKEKEEVYRCMEQHICQVREDLSNLEKRGG